MYSILRYVHTINTQSLLYIRNGYNRRKQKHGTTIQLPYILFGWIYHLLELRKMFAYSECSNNIWISNGKLGKWEKEYIEWRKRQRDNKSNKEIWGENKREKNENLCLIKNWLCDKEEEGKTKKKSIKIWYEKRFSFYQKFGFGFFCFSSDFILAFWHYVVERTTSITTTERRICRIDS